MLDFAVIFDIG